MRYQVWNNCCSECVCLWRERKFQARTKGVFGSECVFMNFGFGSMCWRFGIPLFLSKSLLPNLFEVNRFGVVPKFQFFLIQMGSAIVVNAVSPSNMWMHQVSVIVNLMLVLSGLLWIPTWSFLVTSVPVTVVIETTSPWQGWMFGIRLRLGRVGMCGWTRRRWWLSVWWVSLDHDGSRCYFQFWCNIRWFHILRALGTIWKNMSLLTTE